MNNDDSIRLKNLRKKEVKKNLTPIAVNNNEFFFF